MKKLFAGSVVFVVLVAAGQAYSADLPVTAAPNYPYAPAPICRGGDIVRANNQVSVDFVETNINYGPEFLTGVGTPLDSEKGWVPGFSVTGSLMNNIGSLCNVYLMGRFTWVEGNTQYWASGGPVTSSTDNATVNNADFRLGKGFSLGPNAMLTPFVGGGTNWWDRFLTGPFGYDEKYSHGYVGGGAMLQFSPAARWVLSVDGLVGETIASSMATSTTPGGSPVIFPQTYTLGSKLMYVVGGSIDYAFSQHWHANVGVEYVHFAYGQSPVSPIDGSLEPNSTTSYLSLSVGAGFGW